jgi:hypothetical protein
VRRENSKFINEESLERISKEKLVEWFLVSSRYLREESEEDHEIMGQGTAYPRREWNRTPLEYELEELQC